MTKKTKKLASTVPSATEVAERPKRVRKAKPLAAESPLLRQIREAKEKHPGMLLLFQVGEELCELFGEDADAVAKVLRLPLSQREEGDETVPTVAFPQQALEAHLSKILQAGHKVAICERVEDVPKPQKGKKGAPVEESKPADPRFSWPTSPTAGYCASAVSWHTWQSSCGHFQVARIVGRQGAKSGFSCQFRAEVPDGSWELIAHEKAGPTYTRLFRTLREVLEETDKYALEKLGHGAYNLEQVLSEAEKQGMADVPATQNESKPSRRVAEEVSTVEVPPYEVKENTVKISKSKAVELLLAVGLPSANMKQPTKVIAKNLATLPKMDGVAELQLDDDELQKLLTEVLKDLGEDAKKGVEIVEDAPAKGGKGKGGKAAGNEAAAKPSKNGNGKGFGTHTGQRYELFGHPVTAVIRWMGKNNFNFASARKALDAEGVSCADATVKIQLRAGAKGERGDPAKLSKEDQAKLVKAGK